ncbi:MAG: glycosyltransferase [Acidobacteriia bacterium]|nr:glycosyltransferase [Terriglobia bacterium]
MTVGFDSPLPPARTGVADYAASLLAALRRHGAVEVNPRRADVRLYHLGNNHLHRDIYQRALARPGVAVLHDAVLQHFFLGSLDEQEYAEEFVYNYGEWHRELARQLWRGRSSSGLSQRYFMYPMLRRIAEVSHAVVVHNPAAARMVREHAPAARVVEIPHLFAPPDLPSEAETQRYRQTLGLSPRQFVFGVFGYLRESKRIMNILRAFDPVQRRVPGSVLLICGDFVSRDLARAAEPLLGAPGVLRLPHLPEREFWLAASAVDACINLRYPGAGETSGISVRLMGIGKPVMVTTGEETVHYPETACFRIPPGVTEKASLAEHGLVAASLPETVLAMGRRAAEHIRSFHSLDRVAEQYWQTLCAIGH